MIAKSLPPIDKLHEVLSYDPATGVLTWTDKATRHKGKEAGNWCKDGYREVKIDGVKYYAHRICYALHYGIDPHPLEIDHINRNKGDNAINNLRMVTSAENSNNRGEYDRKLHIARTANMKPVKVTYPDGGMITTKSISLAAFVLELPAANLRKALWAGHGRICQDRRPTGLLIAYA